MSYNKTMENKSDRILLEVKTSRTGEESPEAMVQFLSNLVSFAIPITLEIGVIDQTIHFYISVPQTLTTFIESQLVSQYPKALFLKTRGDPLSEILSNRNNLTFGQMKISSGYLYPLRTFRDFKDVDPMSSLVSVLSK